MEEIQDTSETMLEIDTTVYPSLTDRIKSSVIDILFVIFLMSIIAPFLDIFTEVPDELRAVLFIFLFFIYEPLAHTLGFTLGNYIMGLRVRKSRNKNATINLFQAYLRFTIKSVLGWISFFTIHSNKKRKAMHDIVSDTVVIYA
jgi:uncharacterized RDD family membrane protein YckC